MKAVILAAGKGTRLLPLTETIPKAMVLVNDKPMLQILLEQLKSFGIRDILIVTHHHKEKIENYFKNGSAFGVNLHYAFQKEMKGNADALLQAEHFINEERFLCIACDSLFETSLLARLIEHKAAGVMTGKPVLDARRYGIILTEGEKVKKIIEKPEHPPSNLANFSVYVLPAKIFAACRVLSPGLKGEYLLTDAIQHLINQRIEFNYVISEHIIDIGTLEQLEEAQQLAKQLGI